MQGKKYWYIGIINVTLCIVVCFLLFISMFSNVYIDDTTTTYFVGENLLINIVRVVLGLIMFALVDNLVQKLPLQNNGTFRILKLSLISVAFVLSVSWVMMNQIIPAADQYELQKAATDLFVGSNTPVIPGGYIDRYHFQAGYILFIFLLTPIVGSYNYLFWMMLNCVGLFAFLWLFILTLEELGVDRRTQIETLFFLLIWYPLILYTTFPYGNILGLAFICGTIYFSLKYLRGGNIRYVPILVIMMFLGMNFKGTILVFAIAIIMYMLYVAIVEKNKRSYVIIISILLGYVLSNWLPIYIVRQMTGASLTEGVSTWSWIAMGMQDGGTAAGWWNGYNWYMYDECGYSNAEMGNVAKIVAWKRLAFFSHNIPDFFRFYYQKLASEWNNPTFQSMYYNSIRESAITKPDWVNHFLGKDGVRVGSAYLKTIHLTVLIGTLMYAIKRKKMNDVPKLLYPVIFIGGFFLFIFWEAQAQNTWMFFICLIPCSLDGLQGALACVKEKRVLKTIKENRLQFACCMIAMLFFLLVYFVFCAGCLTLDFY